MNAMDAMNAMNAMDAMGPPDAIDFERGGDGTSAAAFEPWGSKGGLRPPN